MGGASCNACHSVQRRGNGVALPGLACLATRVLVIGLVACLVASWSAFSLPGVIVSNECSPVICTRVHPLSVLERIFQNLFDNV